MGIISNKLLLEKGLRADFMKAFEKAEDPSDVMDLIMKTGSSSDQEKYGWLGQTPVMSEWTDERVLRGIKDYDYSIVNKDFEATLQVDKNTMDDDQLGAVKVRINDLAKRAKSYPRKLFFDALIAGTTDLCYDGQAYFSASHPESGTNQSNLLSTSYTGTLPTLSELGIAMDAAEAALMAFKDDQAELINDGEIQLKVVCSPAIKGLFRKLLNAQEISSTTNTWKGRAELLVSGRLSGAPFYVFNKTGGLKPLVWQERQGIKFEAQDKGERAFMRKQLLYGIDARWGFSYGLWSKAVKMSKA